MWKLLSTHGGRHDLGSQRSMGPALWVLGALGAAVAASCPSAEDDAGIGGAGATSAAPSSSSSSSAASTGGGGSGGTGGAGCECTAAKPICDEATGECFECLPTDDPCPTGQYCKESSKTCEVG